MIFFKEGKYSIDAAKNDTVEQPVFQYAGRDIPMNETKVRIVAEHPRCLLQLREINIHPRYLRSGDLRQMMGQPAIPATHLQDILGFLPPPQIPDQPERRASPDLPFPIVGVLSGYFRQFYQFLVGAKPILQAADNDILLFEEYLP